MFKPLKTELIVDACVLVPMASKHHKDKYISGRVHEVTDDYYIIEWLIQVQGNTKKMTHLHKHKMSELVVVFSAWCSKCWIAVV